GLIGFGHLLRIMRRNAEPTFGTDDLPRALRRKIILAKMDAVEFCRQAEVCAIVHDELRTRTAFALQFTGMRQHGSSIRRLVPILNEEYSRSDQIIRRFEKQLGSREARGVKDCV